MIKCFSVLENDFRRGPDSRVDEMKIEKQEDHDHG